MLFEGKLLAQLRSLSSLHWWRFGKICSGVMMYGVRKLLLEQLRGKLVLPSWSSFRYFLIHSVPFSKSTSDSIDAMYSIKMCGLSVCVGEIVNVM